MERLREKCLQISKLWRPPSLQIVSIGFLHDEKEFSFHDAIVLKYFTTRKVGSININGKLKYLEMNLKSHVLPGSGYFF